MCVWVVGFDHGGGNDHYFELSTVPSLFATILSSEFTLEPGEIAEAHGYLPFVGSWYTVDWDSLTATLFRCKSS